MKVCVDLQNMVVLITEMQQIRVPQIEQVGIDGIVQMRQDVIRHVLLVKFCPVEIV